MQNDAPPNLSPQAAFANLAASMSANLPWILQMHSVLGYPTPDKHNAPYLRFHKWLYEPQRQSIAEWKENNPEWFKQFQDGVLGSPRESCAAAFYHAENLATLERTAVEASKHIPLRLPPASVSAMTFRKIDFEYQAYVLAYDRYFEHLTLGLNGFFKHQSHDFEDFGNLLRRLERNPVARDVANVYDKYRPRFEPTFSKGPRQSVRSQLLHRMAVSAGTLNINSAGYIYFVGGGENLPAPHSTGGGKRLYDLTSERFELMHEYTSETLDAFIGAIPEWESWNAQKKESRVHL